MAGFAGILVVRFFLETLSSHSQSGVVALDSAAMVHYGLFFLAGALGIACILQLLTRRGRSLANIALFSLPVIWLAPIIDFIASGGKGFEMTYLFDGNLGIIRNFFTFSGPSFSPGTTIGIRIEIVLILCLLGWYAWKATKSKTKTAIAVFLSYSFIFILGSLPGIFYTLSNPSLSVSSPPSEASAFFARAISESAISHNNLHKTLGYGSYLNSLETGFNKFMSQALFLLSFLLGIVWFLATSPKKFAAIIKNSRPKRVAHYLALLALGMLFAALGGFGRLSSWADTLAVASLFLAWYSAWLFAVHINDAEDVEIDRISNPARPIIQNSVSAEEMRDVGSIWLVAALIGAWSAGYYPFYMMLAVIALSYVYSAQPLRLRRVPILSSFLIGLACLASVLAGFFFLSQNKDLRVFPSLIAGGIVLMYTLGANMRDMKDVEGDSSAGIRTVPTLFKTPGLGKKIVGSMLALSFLLAPVFFSFPALYFAAVPAAITGYALVTRKKYDEFYIFMLYFAFLACGIFLHVLAR